MAASVLAILTAIEEVALGTIGTTETVPAGKFERGAYAPEAIGAPARAFVVSKVEVEASPPKDTGLVPRSSNLASLEYDFTIRCMFTTEFELDDDARRGARATAAEDTELVRAVVTRPQNLRLTSGGTATQLAGGCLIKATAKTVGIMAPPTKP